MYHSPSLLVPEAPLSVAGLTAYIQTVLEQDDHLRQVWITGEVSSATRYRSGLFFTLQDPDERAAINCVVWNNQVDRLAYQPAQGEKLVILGRVHVHPQRGAYQLIVWQVLPAGEGLRALRYRQLRHRLEAEGLFDPARKRSLPPHPQTVAVVTSPQAAAWGDIQRTLKRRYPGLRVLLSPALVQGEQAPASIAAAIQRVERDGRADVLILSRGGGAVEDMACFNDELVIRAVAQCSIPVIAGIGHQRDESLADLAADVCAHTPTAAAELAVPRLEDLRLEHQERQLSLKLAIQAYLEESRNHLHHLHDRLRRVRIDRQLRQEVEGVLWLRQQLALATRRHIQQAVRHCQSLREKLVALDPEGVLQRGYAVVRQGNGAIVRTAQEVQPGQELSIQLGRGLLRVRVVEALESGQPQVNPQEEA